MNSSLASYSQTESKKCIPTEGKTLTCKHCFKTYNKKSTYEKHSTICNFIYLTNKEKKEISDNLDNRPTYEQLISMVQYLLVENQKINDNIKSINLKLNSKNINETKKINKIEFLNTNTNPNINFTLWKEMFFDYIDENHVLLLDKINLTTLINKIIYDFYNLQIKNNYCSIVSFYDEYTYELYAYDYNDLNSTFEKGIYDNSWTKINDNDFSTFVEKITSKLMKIMELWYNNNLELINNNDDTSSLYPKIMGKLCGFSKNSSTKIKKKFIQQIFSPNNFQQHSPTPF